MKLRKFVTCALSTAMVCAMSVPAFAAGELTEPGSSGDLSIGGDVNYAETTIYKVTLPTTSGVSFVLDPQGLLSLGTDGSGTYDEAEAGKIVGTGTMVAKNESSVPIKLSASFYVSDASSAVPTGITLVETADDIDDSTTTARIVVQGTKTQILDTSTIGESTQWGDALAVTSVDSTAADKVSFALEASTYEFTYAGGNYAYELDADASDNYDQVVMQISGQVAKDADWGDYTGDSKKTLQLNTVFSFEGLKEIGADAKSTDVYGLVADETKLVGFTPADIEKTFVKGASDNVTIELAGEIDTVKFTKLGTVDKDFILTSTQATISGSSLTLLGSWIKGFTADAEFVVTLEDGQTQNITLKITTP